MPVKRFAVVAVALVLAVSGCTSAPAASAFGEDRKPVSPSTGATVDTAPHLKVSVPEGAVDRPATLSVVPTDVPPPERPGFVLASPPVEVSVDAPLSRPVRLEFDGAGGPPGALPVVLHHDPGTGWYPVEAGDPGKPVTADRTSLSPFALGWITDAVGWITDHLVGRGGPPSCPAGAPPWARMAASKVDLVTSCLTAEGDKARLRVRNNRGLPLELTVPPGTSAISVDGQPEVVRQVLGSLLGPDKVLLLSGQELVLDWARPARETRIAVRAAFSATSVLPGVAAEALGADDSSTLLALATFVVKCSAAQNQTLRSLGSPELLGAALQVLIDCLGPLTTPAGAAAAATSAVAALNGISESIAVSEKGFAVQVDKVANGLRVVGKILKFYTIAKLVGALGQVAADSGTSDADRTIQLTLSGSGAGAKVNPRDYLFANGVGSERYYFQSPSGKFHCGILGKVGSEPTSSGCHGPTAPVPPRPSSCDENISWGGGMFVDDTGHSAFICTGGVLYGSGFAVEPKVLPYGSSLSVLGYTCQSAENGVRCAHDRTGRGFRISSSSNEQF
ncbi:hypothetical protein [Amycolatopsis sp. BJA-103]|uniref:hypothetical protein n=1 Tax=Amycolatopsis sp. BJA-103 TaxID=1911175 RepID=UPI000C790750|nr:hypothetical protein [Amycolatopsis sp. BJA-103]AUI57274.1 hypothetical protein BKN51_02975 [Amycolatopsis sp. BJA-103]PNE13295.1 hypothetical protein B1H26_41655 [Amycolatopsis sp. BJA-103]